MLDISPTERFSSRARNYARSRPSYPKETMEILKQECGLTPNSIIADIASGTGLFTRFLLENGNRVYGVEPNEAMRNAGQEYLASYPNFTSVIGSAEATTLSDACVDVVTAAQAAHWFDRGSAIKEFRRILKPRGYLVLLWNDRQIDAAPFDREYEAMLDQYGTDYAEVKRRDNASAEFFGSIPCHLRALPNFQEFDYEGLEGRLLSSSYAPQAGHPAHAPMLKELRRIFEQYQHAGFVRMEYRTKLYFGQLNKAK
jgi:ubiquinone/menaquinone biosynthesis C-methylase UbiE